MCGQEDAKSESNDLLMRVESRASKEHVKACLDGKASQGELAELRGFVDRCVYRIYIYIYCFLSSLRSVLL